MNNAITKNNICFIDGQNLYLGTITSNKPWVADLNKLRSYLSERYEIKKAYYYLGCVDQRNQDLYTQIQEAGFILVFREHNRTMLSIKKGNVDTDIVFDIMRNLIDNQELNKIILISGDGDYKKLIDFLIKKDKLLKILFPDGRNASSLYNTIDNKFRLSLSKKNVKDKVKR